MKRSSIFWVVVSVFMIVLLFVLGMLFVFGDKVLEAEFYEQFFSGDSLDTEEKEPVDDSEDGENDGSAGAVGDAGAGVGGGAGGDVSTDSDCKARQYPYSLHNFKESIVCQEQDAGNCVSLTAACSVELYNLNHNLDGDFEIKYTLIDSSQKEIESKTLSKHILSRKKVLMSLNFAISDVDGVDEGSSCFFSMVNIPKEEIC